MKIHCLRQISSSHYFNQLGTPKPLLTRNSGAASAPKLSVFKSPQFVIITIYFVIQS